MRACTTQESEQYGLCLIVGIMRQSNDQLFCRYTAFLQLGSYFIKYLIPHLAPCLFNGYAELIGNVFTRRFVDPEFEIHALADIAEVHALIVGLWSEHVVHMHRDKYHIVHVRDTVKSVQKAQRIGSSRDAGYYYRTRRYEAVIYDPVNNVVSFHVCSVVRRAAAA